MSTKIEWTDETWNPIRGCSRVSEGCRNCYAEKVAYRFSGPGQPYEGLVDISISKAVYNDKTDVLKRKYRGRWNGKIKFVGEHLLDPLRWKKPRRIFVNSMSDLFHENVTDEMRDRIFAVMALCPQHTFQVLTKRPERMLAYLTQQASDELQQDGRQLCVEDAIEKLLREPISCDFVKWPLPNVWLGVSVEDQETADERIPLLLQTPAAVRFISAEPLLGPITFRWAKWDDFAPHPRRVDQRPDVHRDGRVLAGCCDEYDGLRMLDWVIAGGESGPGARPMHPDWARSLRDQCEAAGVPFFFKQWGEWGDWDGRDDNDPAADAVARIVNSDGDVNSKLHNFATSDAPEWAYRIGKKAAGHLLDGKEWHQFPGVKVEVAFEESMR